MKLKRIIQFAIVFMLITGLSISTVHVDKAQAATTNKVKVTTYYAGNNKKLPYPKVSGLKNKTVENKINTVLINHAKESKKKWADMNEISKSLIENEASCTEDGQISFVCNFYSYTTYAVKYIDNSILSLYIRDSMYGGGAHESSYVETFNFNLNTGKRIFIGDVLYTKSKYQRVSAFATKYNKYHYNIKVNSQQEFFYNKNGISLLFQEYEIGSYADGNIIVNVPRSVYK